jgi:hypothetical protein
MNSKKSYRILKGQNTFVNFDNQKIQIGDVIVMDKKNHRKHFNIFDFLDSSKALSKIITGSKSDFEFNSKSTFNLEFSNQRNSIPILAHEAQISFSKSKSIFFKFESLRSSELPIGYIEEELTRLWKDKGFDNGGRKKHYHLVTEIFEAEAGLMLYSKSANTSAKISANVKVPLVEEADFLKNEVSIQANSNYLLHHQFKETFTPLYKSLRYYGDRGFGYQ